jgi:hypothetical protein
MHQAKPASLLAADVETIRNAPMPLLHRLQKVAVKSKSEAGMCRLRFLVFRCGSDEAP